jgi:hypothetical protein
MAPVRPTVRVVGLDEAHTTRARLFARDWICRKVDSEIVRLCPGSISLLLSPDDAPSPSIDYLARPGRPKSSPFTAELDMVELDEMGRTQGIWSAKGAGLSRSNIVVNSRRMVYAHRTIGVLIHLIDSKPVVLFGRAVSCDYAGEGRYVVDLDLIPIPDCGPIAKWAAEAAA